MLSDNNWFSFEIIDISILKTVHSIRVAVNVTKNAFILLTNGNDIGENVASQF